MYRINKYYSKRAQEYEQIYQRDDPIRQNELNKIAEEIKKIFYNKNVLEVACGTGFWTVFLSETANKIVATDNSEKVLKNYYSEEELVKIFSRSGKLLDIHFGNYFWYIYYEVK